MGFIHVPMCMRVCFYTCMIWVSLQERTRTALLEVLVQELARKTNELCGTSSPGPVSSKDSRNFMDNIKRALSKKEPRVTESSTRRSNGSASLTPVGEDQSASVSHSLQPSYNVNNLVIVYSHPKMLISLLSAILTCLINIFIVYSLETTQAPSMLIRLLLSLFVNKL